MVVLIAIAAVLPLLGWTVYSLQWIRARHEVFNRTRVRAVPPSDGSQRAPAGLWLFGEDGVANLWCWSIGPGDAQEVQLLFPEAEIAEFDGGPKEPPEWFVKMGTPR